MDYTDRLPPIVPVDHWTLKQVKKVREIADALSVFGSTKGYKLKYGLMLDEHAKACFKPHDCFGVYFKHVGVPPTEVQRLTVVWFRQLVAFYDQLIEHKRKLKAEKQEKRRNDKNELHEWKTKHTTLLKALEHAGVHAELVDDLLYKITVEASGKTYLERIDHGT